MKIIFFGASKFVVPLINMLHTNFELALVVTTENDPADTVPMYCKKFNIPSISIKTFHESLSRIQQENAQLGVLAYFGILLPNELLELFPKGIINIHPSLLPKYRGAMPVQTALLNRDMETGVTIIKLDKQMDHGPIIARKTEKILPLDTTASLHDRLFTKGTQMLQEIIPQYVTDKIALQTQNDDQATYTKRSLTRLDGYIDLSHPPSPEILDRMIRAYYPWPTVWTKVKLRDQEVRIKLLPKKKIQVEGKKPVNIKDFVNGYPELKETIEKVAVSQ